MAVINLDFNDFLYKFIFFELSLLLRKFFCFLLFPEAQFHETWNCFCFCAVNERIIVCRCFGRFSIWICMFLLCGHWHIFANRFWEFFSIFYVAAVGHFGNISLLCQAGVIVFAASFYFCQVFYSFFSAEILYSLRIAYSWAFDCCFDWLTCGCICFIESEKSNVFNFLSRHGFLC